MRFLKSLNKGYLFNLLSIIFPWLVASVLILFSAFLYLKKSASFRFLDEENNIVPGYLMTQGLGLYKDIFMNHNPLTIVMSQIIQSVVKSDTLFDLIKLHRSFMIAFGLVANLLLLIRFGSKALVFVGIYEFLRFYISGQMFLAEGMIAYAIAYFMLLLIEIFITKRSKVLPKDILISTFLFSFIVLSREPYVPLAIVLYTLILSRVSKIKYTLISAFLSATIISVFMLQFNIPEFYKQVVLLNGPYATQETKVQGGMQIYSGILNLYEYIFAAITLDKPLYIILAVVNITLFILVFTHFRRSNKRVALIQLSLLFLILFLAGIRNFASGVEWFGMYRSIPYIVILISIVSGLISKKMGTTILFFVLLIAFTHPRSHFLEKRDNASEYYINYSPSYSVGSVFRMLCDDPSCTLHIDGLDIYPYFVSRLKPSYKYAIYYPLNEKYLDYQSIRQRSLTENSPSIYYDSACKVTPNKLPKSIENDYIRLKEINLTGEIIGKSCIAVKKSIVSKLNNQSKADIRKNLLVID